MKQDEHPHACERSADAACAAGIDLDQLLFSAKIDYLKISTEGEVSLPRLDGKSFWARKDDCRWLTVHDVTPEDVVKLVERLGDVPIRAMEIAVDIRPRPGTSCKTALLGRVMVEVFAAKLNPSEKTGINKAFRVFYRHGAAKPIGPFNRRLPKPTDQQLHGGKYDPIQVKCYFKRVDMKRDLEEAQYVARMEARLEASALREFGLHQLSDLFAFEFRKALMPFFSHVRGTRRRRNSRAKLKGNWAIGVNRWHTALDHALFDKAGVGAFLEGGLGDPNNVILLRDTSINNRVGQALHRLKQAFDACGFVRFQPPISFPTASQAASGVDSLHCAGKSPMTYQ